MRAVCITMLMPLLALVFLRWLCSSLVVPSWKVLGRAPRSMVNSGVFSSNRAISTTWAACRCGHTNKHNVYAAVKNAAERRFEMDPQAVGEALACRNVS